MEESANNGVQKRDEVPDEESALARKLNYAGIINCALIGFGGLIGIAAANVLPVGRSIYFLPIATAAAAFAFFMLDLGLCFTENEVYRQYLESVDEEEERRDARIDLAGLAGSGCEEYTEENQKGT
jgi:hypothetical protein